MKKTAREFLKENGVLFKYYRNMIFQAKNRQEFKAYTLNKFFASNQFHEDLIVSAFIWSGTTEGHDFWLELDNKWRKNLDQ